MSRNEGKIAGAGEVEVDASEILAALAQVATGGGRKRQDAVSCYLSTSEGWKEAGAALGGAFATDDPGLRGAKDE